VNSAEEKKPLIQVLDRAFDLLELLARERRAMKAAEIAEKLQLPPKTVNNLLRSLYGRGYLSQDEKRYYRLGPQCFYLGSFADRWKELRKRSARPLRELCAELPLLGFVGVIENDKLFCVAIHNPDGNPPDDNGGEEQKWAEELHSTASGRVLLASLDSLERRKLFARLTRKKTTPVTVTDSAELERICETVAAQGFCEIADESVLDVCSIAVPVRSKTGLVIAAVALAGPSRVWHLISQDRKLSLLRKAAGEIGEEEGNFFST
jgi:IclR family acetate operon transcriptional repressor